MVTVFGSINLDLVCRVARFPAPGETIAGSSFATFPGGKGANQALAAARAGADVRLHGAIGNDAFAAAAMALLAARWRRHSRRRTGRRTHRLRDHSRRRPRRELHRRRRRGQRAGEIRTASPTPNSTSNALLVLQHEVEAAANAALIARARRSGARILLNAAPARPVPLELLRAIDILVVNESEASDARHSASDGPQRPAISHRAPSQRRRIWRWS